MSSIKYFGPSPQLILLRGVTGSGKSSVARCLADISSVALIIEVDAIKEQLHGSPREGGAPVCVPEVDFRTAGNLARSAISRNLVPVVVEPLYREEYVEFVLQSAGLKTTAVGFVWLDCPLSVSLERKCPPYEEALILRQHCHRATRYTPVSELLLDASDTDPGSIAQAILDHFRVSAGG